MAVKQEFAWAKMSSAYSFMLSPHLAGFHASSVQEFPPVRLSVSWESLQTLPSVIYLSRLLIHL